MSINKMNINIKKVNEIRKKLLYLTNIHDKEYKEYNSSSPSPSSHSNNNLNNNLNEINENNIEIINEKNEKFNEKILLNNKLTCWSINEEIELNTQNINLN